MMSTQAVLEELALGADGGFMDDSKAADNQDTSPDISSTSVVKLVEDWSHFVNNPLLSDVTVQVADGEKKIHTHRLVLAARCPNLLEHLIEEKALVGRFTLDWREFTASSVLRVLRYIYTSRYEHDTEDASPVHRIALRYHLTDLQDVISSHHHDLVPFLSDDDDEEEEIVEDKLEVAAIPSPKKSLHEEPLDSFSTDVGKTISGPEKIVDMDISASRCVSPPAASVPPSSPDMFAESTYFVDSDEEEPSNQSKKKTPPSSPSDIIDLTQEDRSPSYVGSCEDGFDLDTEMVSHDHFDGDVSMVDGSGVQRKSSFEIQSAPFTNETSILNDSTVPHNSIEKTQLAVPSCSRVSLSFSNETSILNDSRVSHHSFEKIKSPVASCSRRSLGFANELSILNDSRVPHNSFENIKSPVASCSRATPPFADESIPSWNDDCDWNAYASPLNASNHCIAEDAEKSPVPILTSRQDKEKVNDEMDEELNLNGNSSFRCQVIRELADASPLPVDEMNTPEAPRLAKKRKIEVTPLPDYQTMDTPILKVNFFPFFSFFSFIFNFFYSLQKELDKYGLKPLKRKNAVKLLHHIYEELHPLVTDSETSFQEDSPDRGPGKQFAEASPEKSQDDTSSQASQEDFDEEAALEGMDQEIAGSSQAPKSRIPVKDLMPEFFKKRPDIYQKILTYEPISFEVLLKEVRQEGYRCKAEDLLDWLDEQVLSNHIIFLRYNLIN